MPKPLVPLALPPACGFGAPTAQAKNLTGWFVKGAAGHVDYNAEAYDYDLGSEDGTALLVNAGYRWQFIGVEAGYTDLGSVSESDDFGDRAKLSGDGWTVGLNGHFNFTPQWYLSTRVGAFIWKLRGSLTIDDGTGLLSHYSDDRQSMDWYGGIGTGWDINRHWSVGLNFDYYNIDKDHVEIGNKLYTVSAEYRF